MLAALAVSLPAAAMAQVGVVVPPPARDVQAGSGPAVAVFAGGCFWGVQGVFQHVAGVTAAVSGYAGGSADTARYRAVGGGRTGHAEAVEIAYDPAEISYGQLLQIFFSAAHDPTQLNRQGPDVGPQYRSAIFPRDAAQAEVAASYIRQLDAASLYARPIATTVEPGHAFYPAEDYHQDFMTRNPTHPYIARHDLPKLGTLEELFPELFREQPVLVGGNT
jgi:peptide-methionine (S)-S-oxide reductase